MSDKQPFHATCPFCHKVSIVLPGETSATGSYNCPACSQRYRAEEFWTDTHDEEFSNLSFTDAITSGIDVTDEDDSGLPKSLGEIIIPGALKFDATKQPGSANPDHNVAKNESNSKVTAKSRLSNTSSKRVKEQEQVPGQEQKGLKSPFKDPEKDKHRRHSFQAKTLSFPVELKFRSIEYGRKILSSGVCLVLVIVLLIQFVWYNPQHLSGISLPDPMCYVLPCPDSAITSDDYNSLFLQVREHPERFNSLLISFAFSNDGPREIPFPVARLSFFDSQGSKIVARRDFTPDEYLPAQLMLLDVMPPGSQAQAELEIVDPGPDAARYTLALMPEL